jgi:CheY-like chemotaxis protein
MRQERDHGLQAESHEPASDIRVLVVEEDADLLEAIVDALSPRYRSTSCRSAHSALALLESGRRFDVLVVGFQMLEMSGRELHERIAEPTAQKRIRLGTK